MASIEHVIREKLEAEYVTDHNEFSIEKLVSLWKADLTADEDWTKLLHDPAYWESFGA